MSTVEMKHTRADHPGADRDPSLRPSIEQVPELRDGTRERTAMGLTKTAVSGSRGALGAASTGARLHQTR